MAKKQGYGARKDESIAMRVKKKRTKKQLKASANESYGRWGSKAKKKVKLTKEKLRNKSWLRLVQIHLIPLSM